MKKLTIFLAFLLFVGFQAAAQMQITGTVTGVDDGLSIPGVSVMVKGNTTIGTTTDIDGKFSLTVPASAEAIIFSFVGMKTQEIAINGQSVINVAMELDMLGLEEVVVLGYTTKGKNSITGSTIQVKGDALKDVPVVSIDQTLQGKVAGLTISTTSGSPGAVQQIRIRGRGSILAGNEPLYVIDGVPVVNSDASGSEYRSSLSPLAAINSSDIESVTVLKDASATSAYGARGSNGVIVITTKKGQYNNKTKFNLSAFYGFQNRATEGRKAMTADQREELYLEAVYNSYGTTYGFTEAEAIDFVTANTPGLSGSGALTDWIAAGRPNTDWGKTITNDNAAAYNVTLSATGGDKVSSFYTALGYNKTESTVVGNSFRRINGSLNYNRNLSEKVKFSTTNSASNVFQDGIFLEQGGYFANPLLAKYFMSPFKEAFNDDGTAAQTPGSPYSWMYLKDADIGYNDMNRIMSNSFLEWEIIENLKYKTLVGIDYNLVEYKNYQNRHYGDSQGENGTVEQSMLKNYNIVFQNSLAYNFNIDDHNISVMALAEYQENREKYVYAYGESFVADGLTNVNSAGANKDADGTFFDWKNASYLGMVNYSFLGKYIADVTYRREGSSKFDKGYRFGNFWSVGAAWNLSQEDFLANITFVNNFRLRGSYGVSGNSDIDINSYQAKLAFDADYGNLGASYPASFGNPVLGWEKNTNYDLGFDFAFLNNRVNGSFSYFNKKTYDLLLRSELSRTSGHDNFVDNVGEVVNKGVEAIINLAVIESKDFNLNLSFNFASLDNNVTKLSQLDGEWIPIISGAQKTDVGQPIYSWWMKKWAGVNPDTGAAQWYLNGVDGAVTENYYDSDIEEAWQGSPIPTYSGGGSIHADYKGVYFDMNIYFAGGNQVYEDWSFYTHHSGSYPVALYAGVEDLMRRWQEPGDVTDYPIQTLSSVNNSSRTSTRFLYDGDYVRVKDLVLGYNLPKSIVSKIGFEGVSIYARGTNLFTWVKDKGLKYDPEVRTDGYTRFTNPPIKSISFGLNLNF